MLWDLRERWENVENARCYVKLWKRQDLHKQKAKKWLPDRVNSVKKDSSALCGICTGNRHSICLKFCRLKKIIFKWESKSNRKQEKYNKSSWMLGHGIHSVGSGETLEVYRKAGGVYSQHYLVSYFPFSLLFLTFIILLENYKFLKVARNNIRMIFKMPVLPFAFALMLLILP